MLTGHHHFSRICIITLVLISILSCQARKTDELPTSENFTLIEVQKGVYAAIHKLGGKAISNIGIIDNGNETIIFDNFLSPEAAAEIEPIVKSLGLSPIRYVINSHCHNDHIRGNQVFGDDIKIISTEITAGLIAKWEPLDIEDEKEYAPGRFAYYDSLLNVYEGDKQDDHYKDIMIWRPYYEILSKSHEEVKTRIPDLLVEDGYELSGPLRTVQLLTQGPGHTESDLILFLPDEKIVFTGDLVFNKCHPYLAHGYPEEWKQWLDYLSSLDPDHVIPGHGNLGDKSIIIEMKNYITNVEKHASTNIENQVSANSDEFFSIPDQYSDWWFGRFYRPNLTFMYKKMVENPVYK